MYPRRDFMRELLSLGLIPGLGPAAGDLFQQGTAAPAPGSEPDPDSAKFWTDFLDYQSVPAAFNARSRGNAADTAGDAREPFFLHFGTRGLQPAEDLGPADLLPSGDVTVTLNVGGFRPSDADRLAFDKFVNAQLRIDVVQQQPVLDTMDLMAWCAIAAVHPDRTNKLPPLENLSFDPSAESWQRSITLPGGAGSWAVNIFAEKQESTFSKVLNVITGGIDRFAPALGLPEISRTALKAFNKVYSNFASRPQYLFRGNPVSVYATGAALRAQSSSLRGIPLRSGTYVIVPNDHLKYLANEKLENYELNRGLIVPQGTTTLQARDRGLTTMPQITYASIDVTVKAVQASCGTARTGQAAAEPATARPTEPVANAPARGTPAATTPSTPAGRTGGAGRK
jgi:hypothetical protein